MKKIIVSLMALIAMTATSAFAFESKYGNSLEIKLNNVAQKNVDKKEQGPAFSSKSLLYLPVFDSNGQLLGFELALIIDGNDSNVAVIRKLAEYELLGIDVSTVFAASVDSHGKQVSTGFGLVVPLGNNVLPGVNLSVGYVANLTNGSKLDVNFLPVIQGKIDLSKPLGIK